MHYESHCMTDLSLRLFNGLPNLVLPSSISFSAFYIYFKVIDKIFNTIASNINSYGALEIPFINSATPLTNTL